VFHISIWRACDFVWGSKLTNPLPPWRRLLVVISVCRQLRPLHLRLLHLIPHWFETCWFATRSFETTSGAQPRGNLGICPQPENFKTLPGNFDICRNCQRTKMEFCILIIFKKSLICIFLCPTGYLSPYKIYLDTGHLIENFVNDWYLTTNMLELSKLGNRL